MKSSNGNGNGSARKQYLVDLGTPPWAVVWCLQIEERLDRLERVTSDAGATAGAKAGRRWGATLGAFAVAFATTLSTCQPKPASDQQPLPISCERR